MLSRLRIKRLESWKPLSVVLGGCLLACLANAPALGATVSLPASKDAMIFQTPADNGAGGGPGILAGATGQLSIRRGLIAFDPTGLPSNALITDVQLRLVIGQVAGGGSAPNPTIELHRLLVDWGEANTGASTQVGLGGVGQGSPALVGDATWNERFFDAAPSLSNPWSLPGGQSGSDYLAAASASLAQGNSVNDVSLWLSTPSLVSDVQGWLNSPSSNFGWMLINSNETTAQTFRGFYSRNYNPNPAPADLANLFPSLIVTYTVPEPSSVVLLAMGTAVLGGMRWRRNRRVVS